MAFNFKALPTWQKGAIVVGGAGAAYFAWRLKQNAAANAASSSTDSSAIDPVTGLPYSEDSTVDPVTGMTYLEEAQEYGSVSAADAEASSAADTGAYGGYSGDAYGYPSEDGAYYADGSTAPATYVTNAQWAQAVEAGLTDLGWTSTDVAAALGRYLGALSLTSDQATIIQAAVAEYGPPPVGSFQIIVAPATTSTGTGTGTATGTGTTGTTGTTPATTAKPATPSGATASDVTASGFTLHWGAVSGASDYPVRVTYQDALAWSGTAHGTSITVTGLTADHTYTAHVAAANSAGTSAETNGPAVKTAK